MSIPELSHVTEAARREALASALVHLVSEARITEACIRALRRLTAELSQASLERIWWQLRT
jgi:hypothetical protein